MTVKDIFDRKAEAKRLLICTGACCNSTGQAEIFLNELREKLVAEGLDEAMIGRASCVRRSCLGKCTGEPLAYVHPEGIWYHQLTGENLATIFRDHLLENHPVTALILHEEKA
jgi:(2Fe-2S) ferredoxin